MESRLADVAENIPKAHGVHTKSPELAAKVPAGQAAQLAAPAVLEYRPSPQLMQVAVVAAPAELEYAPPVHRRHEAMSALRVVVA